MHQMRRGTIVDRLSSALRGADCFGPVDTPRVLSAEQTLNFRFPISYRVFLELYGAARLPSTLELYGLPYSRSTDDSPQYWAKWTNILDVATFYRELFSIPEDRPAIPICHYGCDTVFALDPSATTIEGEYGVIAMGPRDDCRMISHTFVDFVRLVAEKPPELD